MDAAAARERELALLAQVQDAREHALQLQVDAAKREAEAAKREAEAAMREAAQQVDAARREAALQVEGAAQREEGARREAAQQVDTARREAAQQVDTARREAALQVEGAKREAALQLEAAGLREAALRREMEALRASLGSVQGAVALALAAERARAAEQAARDQYERDQRTLWLRSPAGVLRVLTLVAHNGHEAVGFASLSRAFWGDEALWDAIKDRCGPAGQTRLMWCAQEGDVARARWLLERGARVDAAETGDGFTALIWASCRGHLEIVRELLGRGANVNAAQTNNGRTSLMWAS